MSFSEYFLKFSIVERCYFGITFESQSNLKYSSKYEKNVCVHVCIYLKVRILRRTHSYAIQRLNL